MITPHFISTSNFDIREGAPPFLIDDDMISIFESIVVGGSPGNFVNIFMLEQSSTYNYNCRLFSSHNSTSFSPWSLVFTVDYIYIYPQINCLSSFDVTT